MVSEYRGIAEGYLSKCEDQVRTLEWQLSEATNWLAEAKLTIKEQAATCVQYVHEIQRLEAEVAHWKHMTEIARAAETAAPELVGAAKGLVDVLAGGFKGQIWGPGGAYKPSMDALKAAIAEFDRASAKFQETSCG